MKKSGLLCVACASLLALASSMTFASPAKFNIPGDFPGNFQIDFLGTGFNLSGVPSGTLSTASTIQFSVGSEITPGSGVYNTSVSPSGFNFLGFQPLIGLPFDVYGAGVGTGTFDTNTGHWSIDMPSLFVSSGVDVSGNTTGYATRLDFHLTTNNIFIPGDPVNSGYMTTTASPMVIDELSPDPWGDLNLVAGGIVQNSADLVLAYDFGLINNIGNNYTNFFLDTNPFKGIQYEFNIYGNDPLVSVPIPATVWLFGSGLLGLIGVARKKAA
jgi:hypothetical protein